MKMSHFYIHFCRHQQVVLFFGGVLLQQHLTIHETWMRYVSNEHDWKSFLEIEMMRRYNCRTELVGHFY